MKPLSPKEENKDQIRMKQKRKYENDNENNKTGLITSSNVVKTIMLIPPKINNVVSLWYSPSFSSLSIYNSNYIQHLLNVGIFFKILLKVYTSKKFLTPNSL